jgi:hypothetical protein
MADIDVVQKKGGAGWVMWVVLALVAVGILWMLMRGRDQGEQQSDLGDPVRQTISVVAAAAA